MIQRSLGLLQVTAGKLTAKRYRVCYKKIPLYVGVHFPKAFPICFSLPAKAHNGILDQKNLRFQISRKCLPNNSN